MNDPKRILVIDDDEDLVRSTSALLATRGYSVDGASNGTEGEAKVRSWKPDLVVLDIMMDYDAEGFNLAYRLKEDPATSSIPIVILSGFQDHLESRGSSFDFVMGRQWPAAEMLEKPADPGRLIAVVDRLLADAGNPATA
jgi:DNA-binding response OmpR family regulator